MLPGDVEEEVGLEGVGFEEFFDDFFLPFFEDWSRNPCSIVSFESHFIVEWGFYLRFEEGAWEINSKSSEVDAPFFIPPPFNSFLKPILYILYLTT